MATIIDTLLIELSIDPTKFTAGQKSAVDAAKKLEDELGKHFVAINKQTKDAAENFSKAAKALGDLTLGYLSVSGIASFITQTNQTNYAVGQLATTIGILPSRLAAYEAAARSAGLSPGAMGSTLGGLANVQAGFRVGQIPDPMAMGRMGIDSRAMISNDPTDLLIALANSTKRRQAAGGFGNAPEDITRDLRAYGVTDEMIYLMERHNKSLTDLTKNLEKLKTMTDEQFAAAEANAGVWGDLNNALSKLGTIITTDLNEGPLSHLAPLLTKLIEGITKFYKAIEVAALTIAGFFTGAALGGLIGTVIGGIFGGPGGAAIGFGIGATAGGRIGAAAGLGFGVDAAIEGKGLAGTGIAGDPSKSGSAFLASQRSRFKAEFDADPNLKLRAAALTSLENEGAGPGVVESLMNRMNIPSMGGASIRRGMAGGPNSFYGPARIPGLVESRMRQIENNPQLKARLYNFIDQALGGSNVTGGYTDQGSAGDPNYIAGGTGVNINRERFNDWGGAPGGHAAAMMSREAQQARVRGERGTMPAGVPSPTADKLPYPAATWGDWLNSWKPYLPWHQSSIQGGTTDNSRSAHVNVGSVIVNNPKDAEDVSRNVARTTALALRGVVADHGYT